jgi:hypothetical protein
MKKRFLAGLMAGALLVSGAASADVDLSGMSYEELVALKEQVNLAIQKVGLFEKKPLLYEDDTISIRYSGVSLEKFDTDAYLDITFVFENKTSSEVEVVCKNVIFNGCAIYLSKFVNVPAECSFIHKWTTDAETFLEYDLALEDIETVSITFNIDNGETIRSETAVISR